MENKSDYICDSCKGKINRESFLECSGICGNLFHAKCIGVLSKDCNVAKNTKGFKWFCDTCENYLKDCLNIRRDLENFKKSVLDELNEVKKELISQRKEQTPNNSNFSYSEMVSKKGEPLIIKPKDSKQESSTTRADLTKCLNPSNLKVGITDIRSVREGGVLIKCKTKNEREKLRKEAQVKLGSSYTVNTPKQKYPRFKVCDIEENMSEADLTESIIKQNAFIQHENMVLKLIVQKKMKTRFMAIFECDPLTWKAVIEEGSLCIGWSIRCRVFEYVSTFRCYKCAGFNHKADDCKSDKLCVKCGDSNHGKDECKSVIIKCVNCLEINKKMNLSLDTSHSTFDVNKCTILQKRIAVEKQKVKFDIE